MTFKFISPVPLFFSFLLYWDVATRKLNNDACGSARGRLGSGLQSSGFGRAASARELLPETPWGSQRQPLSMRFGVPVSPVGESAAGGERPSFLPRPDCRALPWSCGETRACSMLFPAHVRLGRPPGRTWTVCLRCRRARHGGGGLSSTYRDARYVLGAGSSLSDKTPPCASHC